MNRLVALICLSSLLVSLVNARAGETRHPYDWPFAQNSPWNMPIGSGAVYVHAMLEPATQAGMTVDEDIIVLKPNAENMDIYTNFADWDPQLDRCPVEGPYLFSAPIPNDFIVGPDTWDGFTPNSALAVLMPDGETIRQTQPFANCFDSNQATSHYVWDGLSIFGDGIAGAHGGSSLSAIGGTLRLGELSPTSGPVRHALKINLYSPKNLYYDAASGGYRWPALWADNHASQTYGSQRTLPPVPACRMGALLALPVSMDLDAMGFETVPARMLAQAFQDYGAYVADCTGWDVYGIETEWSPDGRFLDEFQANWGFSIIDYSRNTPWARDMDRIFLNLHVVDNNGPGSIGGGGTPLQPLAPPFTATSADPVAASTQAIFRAYPNPAQGVLRVEGQGIQRVDVFDVQGRRLYSKPRVEGSALSLPMRNLDAPRGVVFVRVQAEAGVETQKILIE